MKFRVLKLIIFVILLCGVTGRKTASKPTSTRSSQTRLISGSAGKTIIKGKTISPLGKSVHKTGRTGTPKPRSSSEDFISKESKVIKTHPKEYSRQSPTNPFVTKKPTFPESPRPITPRHTHTRTTHAPTHRTYAPTHRTYAPTHRTYAPTHRTYAPTHRTYAPTHPTYAPPYPTKSPPYPTNSPPYPTSGPSISINGQSYPTIGQHPIPSTTIHQTINIQESHPREALIPGRTVLVVQGGSSQQKSGIGSRLAEGAAMGVAAGATNAVVNRVIDSIFRPSSNHVYTYPASPPVGQRTLITNNFYGPTFETNNGAGVSSPSSAGTSVSNGADNNNKIVADLRPPNNNPPHSSGNPSGAIAGVASDGQADILINTNGQVRKSSENPPVITDPKSISDEELMKITEELFDKQEVNFGQYIELLNLQKKVSNAAQETVPDEASEALFKIKPELYEVPTVKTLKALYENYERDGLKTEIITDARRNKESAFVNEIIKTPVMTRALNWMSEHGLVYSDSYEKKELLMRTWFSSINNTSSGFERIFLSEKFDDSGMVGMQNWIYFAHLEASNDVNYLGYVDQLNLSGKGLLLKLNYRAEPFTIQNAAMFVGTSPELELALYTVCFYARSYNWCPISLGGAKFFILTHSFRHSGKDILDLGFPAF